MEKLVLELYRLYEHYIDSLIEVWENSACKVDDNLRERILDIIRDTSFNIYTLAYHSGIDPYGDGAYELTQISFRTMNKSNTINRLLNSGEQAKKDLFLIQYRLYENYIDSLVNAFGNNTQEIDDNTRKKILNVIRNTSFILYAFAYYSGIDRYGDDAYEIVQINERIMNKSNVINCLLRGEQSNYVFGSDSGCEGDAFSNV